MVGNVLQHVLEMTVCLHQSSQLIQVGLNKGLSRGGMTGSLVGLSRYHRYILVFTKRCSCKVLDVSALVLPQVRLHPHDPLLLFPDDGAQTGQQGGLVAPGVWIHTVVQTRQLVQQRLLVLGTGQQLLLGLALALQLGPANEPTTSWKRTERVFEPLQTG